MATPLTTFAEATHRFLSKVVEFYASKGCVSTVDELAAHLSLPVQVPAVHAVAPVPAASMPFGGGVSHASFTAAAPSVPSAGGGGCCYEFKRGPSKGSMCGKSVQPGQNMCTAHAKQAARTGTSAVPTQAPGVVPGLSGAQQETSGSLDAQVFDQSRNLFRIVTHNFIVQGTADGRTVLVGKVSSPESKEVVPCSDQDRIAAQRLGLDVGVIGTQ